MMRDDDLVELFRTLDNDAPANSPPYAESLWAQLDDALTRQQNSGNKPPKTEADIIELRPGQGPRPARFPGRGLVGAVAVAIAAVVLFFALPSDQPDGVVTEADQPSDPTITVDPVPSTQPASPPVTVDLIPGPRLTAPADACQRYAATEPTLMDLWERAPDGEVALADTEAAITALSVLQADLTASGEFTDGDIRRIDFGLAALREASIEIEMGLDEQAAGSLTAALTSVADLILPPETGQDVGKPCVPDA